MRGNGKQREAHPKWRRVAARNLYYSLPGFEPADAMRLLLWQCQCSFSSLYVVSVLEVKAYSGGGVSKGRCRQKAWVLVDENEGLAEVAQLAEHEVGQGLVSIWTAEEAMMGFFDDQHMFAPPASSFRQGVIVEPEKQRVDECSTVGLAAKRVNLKDDGLIKKFA